MEICPLYSTQDRSVQTNAVSNRIVIYSESVRNDLLNVEDLFSSKLDTSDFESCPTVRAVGHTYVPAVGVRYLFDDVQSKASPVLGG